MNDKPLDNNNIAKRLGRYGRISTTMAGLGAKIVGEKFLGLKIERSEHAQDLMLAIGNLKGPLMKVGQILATIPEALPPEYAKAFQELQANAPPMGWSFVRRRMKTELGPDWEKKFKSFSQEAAAAASLGQVHRGVTQSDIEVACKLQYPDMQSAIEADLQQLKIIFSLYERYDKTIATGQIHTELAARLYEELEYTREAKQMQLYATMLKDEAGVHVPTVIPDLSTNRLLTTTWLQGDKILNFTGETAATRNKIALNLFRAWYVPLYYYGIIHGDPHLGNYTVRKDHTINLLDFGCIRVFPPSFVGGVIDLYNALMKNDTALAVHAYETWGFKNLNKDQIETLSIWARFLYAPVMEDKIRPIGETSGGVYGRDTAQKVHEKLRALGSITVPREFVFMDRAALGLGSVFLHLRAEINWYRVFNDLIADFDEAAITKRQAKILREHKLVL